MVRGAFVEVHVCLLCSCISTLAGILCLKQSRMGQQEELASGALLGG